MHIEEEDVEIWSAAIFDGKFQLHQIERGRNKRMSLHLVVDDDLQPCEVDARMREEANAADLLPVGTVREDELYAFRPPTQQNGRPDSSRSIS